MKKILFTTLFIPLFSVAQQESKFEIGAHLSFHNNNHSGTFKYNYDREKQASFFTDGGFLFNTITQIAYRFWVN